MQDIVWEIEGVVSLVARLTTKWLGEPDLGIVYLSGRDRGGCSQVVCVVALVCVF